MNLCDYATAIHNKKGTTINTFFGFLCRNELKQWNNRLFSSSSIHKKNYLISNSSDFWTASWAALTAWLFIPRLEQKRLCKLILCQWQYTTMRKTMNSSSLCTWVRFKGYLLLEIKKTQGRGQTILTIKSPACIVPISTDWPFSNPSCFTMYSFARPISFFVAPLATEQISIWNPQVQGSSYTKGKIIQEASRC